MDFINRILFKATGRKVVVFAAATGLLCFDFIGKEEWMWIALGVAGLTTLDKFPGALKGLMGGKSDA